jgi:predicted acyl esterase
MDQMKSEVRDGMRIDWDAPIPMDDGVVLRCDVYRPDDDGKYPVILSYGPYAKGLSFQEGYKSAWVRMTEAYPEIAEGSSNKYQNWELVDPEKWVPDGFICMRVDSRGTCATASTGPAPSRGRTARSGSPAFRITRRPAGLPRP